jgi:HD domain
VIQRLRQFRDARVGPSPADYELAGRWPQPPLFALFAAQHPRDVVHSARTARWLLARGCEDGAVLIAALLHDIAKGEQRRRDRVAHVVLSATRITGADRRSRFEMRRALARSAGHAEAGAARLRQAGAPERSVALTLRHHAPPGDDRVLALLQEADGAS